MQPPPHKPHFRSEEERRVYQELVEVDRVLDQEISDAEHGALLHRWLRLFGLWAVFSEERNDLPEKGDRCAA